MCVPFSLTFISESGKTVGKFSWFRRLDIAIPDLDEYPDLVCGQPQPHGRVSFHCSGSVDAIRDNLGYEQFRGVRDGLETPLPEHVLGVQPGTRRGRWERAEREDTPQRPLHGHLAS